MATASASLTPISPVFSLSSASAKPSLKRTLLTFHHQNCSRREILKGLAILPLTVIKQPPPSEAREVEVGSYLPQSPSDPSFVLFKASPKDTPALRAGTSACICDFVFSVYWSCLQMLCRALCIVVVTDEIEMS